MNWTRALVSAGAIAACGWLATATVSTQGSNASAQLRAAMHRETVQGDLSGAITEYRRLAEGSGDRAVQAQALLRLGAAYEKLGKPEARATYERVVRSYADIAGVAKAARARLAATRRGAQTGIAAAGTPRLSLERAWGPDAIVNWNSFTLDGRLFTYLETDSGNLMLRDLETGATRQLTTDGTTAHAATGAPYGEAWEHAISPDGQQVAYTYVKLAGKEEGRRQLSTELRVANADGTQRRTIAAWGGEAYVGPPAWTPDQQCLSVTTTVNGGASEVLMLALADPKPRVLASHGVMRFLSATFSPDGRHLAVNARKRFGSQDWDVMLLELKEGVRVGEPHLSLASDRPEYALAWSSDGRQLVFDSERNGTAGIWRQPMEDGRATGLPVFVRETGQRISAAVLSTNGALSYVVRPLFRNAMSGRFDNESARLVGLRAASSRYEDVTVALGWSPDGRWFAYTTGSGALMLQESKSGVERPFRLGLSGVRHIQWHPNSRALVVTGSLDGKDGMYAVDIETTRTEFLVGSVRLGEIAPDGRTVYAITPDGMVVAAGPDGRHRTLQEFTPGNLPSMLVTSPDGKWVATADAHTLWLVPSAGGKPAALFRPGDTRGQITSLAWIPDGRHLLVGLSRQGARPPEVWRVAVADGAEQRINVGLPLDGVAWFRSLHPHPVDSRLAITPWGWRGEVWRMSNFLPAR